MDERDAARYQAAMQPISLLTVCGLEELTLHGSRGVTHVLSILDPEWPEPEAFASFPAHHRTILRFHDAIQPGPGLVLPAQGHVEAIIGFGRSLAAWEHQDERHLLVHCHAGISRSTAAMAILMAQVEPDMDEDSLFAQLTRMRAKAWPNSRMIGFADAMLGRGGRLTQALGRLYRRQLEVYPHMQQFMQANGRARELEMAA
jgi:predicted protein tyrosine phosphatase